MKKPFQPEHFKSFEELPEEKKGEFKAVEGGFVRKSAVESEEALEGSERIVIAKTKKLKYTPGESDVETGIKEGSGPGYKRGEFLGGGRRVVRGGYGSYVVAFPSQYDLYIEVEGKEHRIFAIRDFRLALGIARLTEKKRKIIEQSMPRHIQVIEKIGQKGTPYYRVAEDDMIAWAERVKRFEYQETKRIKKP